MAVKYFLRTKNKSGFATLFVRVNNDENKVDIKLSTKLEVDVKVWNAIESNVKKREEFQQREKVFWNKLQELKHSLESISVEYLTKELVLEKIDSIIYKEQRAEEAARLEAARLKEIEDAKLTFVQYAEQFLADIKSGKQRYKNKEKHVRYKPTTIKNYAQMAVAIKSYEIFSKRTLYFDDINLEFYSDFNHWLEERDASINTIGTHFKCIKYVMKVANKAKLHSNLEYQDSDFSSVKEDGDEIALTEDEVKRFSEVDLSKYAEQYLLARDIFMVGILSSQRISDYNNLKKDNIKEYIVKVIEGERIVERKVLILTLLQKKTNYVAAIPVKSQLRTILEKYNYQIPKINEQVFNRYIKEIGRLAGIDAIEVKKITKGGKEIEIECKRYERIASHTARRTGATLMYLNNVDVFDIMVCTGHKKIETLEKYIKLSATSRALKMAQKYSYFQS